MNYIFKKNKLGENKVIRIRYPVFVGTIIPAYEIVEGRCSKSHHGKKIRIDEILDDCLDSKLEWSCKRALSNYKRLTEEEPTMTVLEQALDYVKSNQKYLNITSIEESSGITRTSLTTAINRDQKRFGQANHLVRFLDNNFDGWKGNEPPPTRFDE